MKNIINKIKKAPIKPGVYFFKTRSGKPLYIGRSASLKDRLGSYLSSSDPKIKALLNESSSVSFIETENLLDAVIKEANLIKQYKPKYNVKEKDDRSFIYIEIKNSDWPYPRLTREKLLNKENDFFFLGPFKSLKTARNLLSLARKMFPYSTCSKGTQNKPCFHRQIELCPGKCTGEITEKEYRKNINNLILFLKGDKNKSSVSRKLNALKQIDDHLFINRDEEEGEMWEFSRIEGYDVTHFGGKEASGGMILFRNGNFDKSGYRTFKIREAKPGDDIGSLKEVLRRRLNHKEWDYPDLIVVDGGKGQVNAFDNIISESGLKIPVIGISKYKEDKMVPGKMFSSPFDAEFLNFLKMIRDEVHRFSNSFRTGSRLDGKVKKDKMPSRIFKRRNDA